MMKNLKLIGIIALAAIIGLGMISCGPADEECADGEHEFGTWDTSGSVSIRVCDKCGFEETCVCTFGNWAAKGTDGTGARTCTGACAKEELLTISHFYGTWTGTFGSSTFTAKIDSAGTTFEYEGNNNTLKYASYTSAKDAGGNFSAGGSTVALDLSVGFKLTGTGATGTWASNAYVRIFMNKDGKAIRIALTDQLQSAVLAKQ